MAGAATAVVMTEVVMAAETTAVGVTAAMVVVEGVTAAMVVVEAVMAGAATAVVMTAEATAVVVVGVVILQRQLGAWTMSCAGGACGASRDPRGEPERRGLPPARQGQPATRTRCGAAERGQQAQSP